MYFQCLLGKLENRFNLIFLTFIYIRQRKSRLTQKKKMNPEINHLFISLLYINLCYKLFDMVLWL